MQLIKIRAWDAKEKRMQQPYIEWKEHEQNITQTIHKPDWPFWFSKQMIFTGFQDTKKKDIYEGDIVHLNDCDVRMLNIYHVVKWYHGEFRTTSLKKFHSTTCPCGCLAPPPGVKPSLKDWRRMRVVGNIYEASAEQLEQWKKLTP